MANAPFFAPEELEGVADLSSNPENTQNIDRISTTIFPAAGRTMDVFGNTDPNRMPQHLFFGALAVHHETAIRANTEKQNYSVCPRHWYIDAEFVCDRCGEKFVWTANEQKAWFEDYFFWVDSRPRQCMKCRGELRRLLALQKEYDANVAAARNHGTLEQKNRIVDIVSELQRAWGRLPDKMTSTMELFQRQIAKRLDASTEET